MARRILSKNNVSVRSVFRLFGRFTSTGKFFFFRRVVLLEDKYDYIFHGAAPEEFTYATEEEAIREFYSRVL